MSTARQILSNTFIQIFGKIVTALISVFIVKIITGYLGVAGYGDYTTVYEFLNFFGIVVDLGLFTIAVREMSKEKADIPFLLGNILSIRLVVGLIVMSVAILSAFLIPQYQNTVIPIGVSIAAVTTLLNILNGALSSVLQVHLRMDLATHGLIFGKIISFIYMLYVVYIGFKSNSQTGFNELLIAGVVGNIAMLGLTYFFVRRYSKLKLLFDLAFWKKILLKSLPYGLALILNTIYFRIDVILLSILKDNTEVGIYGVALRMLEVLIIIPLFFMNAVLPVMTRFLKENREKLARLWQYSFDFLLALGAPILAGSIVLAAPIINLVSNQDFITHDGFLGADIALKILMFALLFSFLSALFNFTLVALDQQIKLMWINFSCVIFKIIVSLNIIPSYGFRGAAISSAVAELFILIASFATVFKTLKLGLNAKSALKIALSATTMAGFLMFIYPLLFNTLHSMNKAVSVAIMLGSLVYVAMLFVTRGISKEMIGLVWKKS